MKYKSPRENGFSLIELMITLVIMTVVVGLILTMLAQMLRMSSVTHRAVDTQQGVRNAMEFITRDLLITGDGLSQVNNIRTSAGFVRAHLSENPVISTNPDLAVLGLITSDGEGSTVVGAPTVRFVPSPTVGDRVGVLNGTDRISMMRFDPDFAQVTVNTGGFNNIDVSAGNAVAINNVSGASRFNENEIYLFTNGMSAALGTVTSRSGNTLVLTDGDVHQMNRGGAAGAFGQLATNKPVAIVRVQLVEYFVSDDNLLIRRVYGIAGRGFVDSTIAENVTNFQVNYRIDRNTPGTNIVDSTDSITVNEQSLIRDVEFTITAQPVDDGIAGQSENNRPEPYTISSSSSTGIRNLEFREYIEPGSGTP